MTKMQKRFRDLEARQPEHRPLAWYDQPVEGRIAAMVWYLRQHAACARTAEHERNRYDRGDRNWRLAEWRRQGQLGDIRRLISVIRHMERTGEVVA